MLPDGDDEKLKVLLIIDTGWFCATTVLYGCHRRLSRRDAIESHLLSPIPSGIPSSSQNSGTGTRKPTLTWCAPRDSNPQPAD